MDFLKSKMCCDTSSMNQNALPSAPIQIPYKNGKPILMRNKDT
jgi:hypothetical protein